MKWLPISTAPKDGTYVLVLGDSGYINTPYRVTVAKYDVKFRPLQPWVDHANDSVTDYGDPPTHWMQLPPVPEPGPMGPEGDFTLQVIAFRVAKKGELYVGKDNRIHRCDSDNFSKRARKVCILVEKGFERK